MGDLGKLNGAKGFKNLPKVQEIAQSGHTDKHVPRIYIPPASPPYSGKLCLSDVGVGEIQIKYKRRRRIIFQSSLSLPVPPQKKWTELDIIHFLW